MPKRYIVLIAAVIALIIIVPTAIYLLRYVQFFGQTIEKTSQLRFFGDALTKIYDSTGSYPADINEAMRSIIREKNLTGTWFYEAHGRCYKLLFVGVYCTRPDFPDKSGVILSAKNGQQAQDRIETFMNEHKLKQFIDAYMLLDCNDPNL